MKTIDERMQAFSNEVDAWYTYAEENCDNAIIQDAILETNIYFNNLRDFDADMYHFLKSFEYWREDIVVSDREIFAFTMAYCDGLERFVRRAISHGYPAFQDQISEALKGEDLCLTKNFTL